LSQVNIFTPHYLVARSRVSKRGPPMTPGCCLLLLRCHMLQLHLGLVHRRSSLNTRSISHHTLSDSNSPKWCVRETPSRMGQANIFNRPHRTPLVSRRCSMYVHPKLCHDSQSDHLFDGDATCANEASCERRRISGSRRDEHKQMAGARG
jgi:hypothetical protein